MSEATLNKVLLMAEDLGRLRRTGVENWALERLCDHLDALDAMLRPSAGELVRCGVSVHDALGAVDRQRAMLRSRLGTHES